MLGRERDLNDTARRRRPALLVLAAVVLIVLFTAWQAWMIRSSLLDARDELRALVDRVDGNDPEGATEAAHRADDATARADWHSHTPVWWVAQHLPLVGDDVKAVRTVSAATHDLTEGVVSPMAEAGLTPDQFKPQDGRIPIEPLRRVGAVLEDAAPRVTDAADSTEQLETSGLVRPLRGPVEELQSMLSVAERVTRGAVIAAELLPSMLGEESERTYVLMFQNNAEVRAIGGMPGTLAVLTVLEGRLSMERTLVPDELATREPVAELTEQERQLFPPRVLTSARPTFLPDFARAGEILAAFWEASGRAPIDGVLSVDPVALSYILEYTGPVSLKDGTVLTSDNTVEILLQDTYEIPDLQAQDRFFARAARTIFNTVIRADGSVRSLVDALSRSIDERRIAAWSAHGDEQAILGGEDIANELPQDTGRPEIGIYINGAKGDKLGYYLHNDWSVTSKSCSESGAEKLTVVVQLSSTVPSDLPKYVYGTILPGLPRDSMRNRVYLYAPTGGGIGQVTAGGRKVRVERGEHGVRPVAHTTIDLAPGEVTQLRYVVQAGPGQEGEIRVLSTPLADGTGGESSVDSGC